MSDIDSIIEGQNVDKNNPEYNEKLMGYYIEHEMNIPAKAIADRFPDYAPIQLMLIEMYQKDRNKEGMIQIAERFPNDIRIQSIAIGMYINDDNMEKVNEILDRFPTYDRELHYKACMKLKDKKKFYAVERLGKMFPDVPEIQGKVMSTYILQLKYSEAEEIGNRDIFAETPGVQAKMMRIYRIKANYEAADELAERFPDSPEVQYEYMRILQSRRQFEKIGQIADKFPDNERITKLYKGFKSAAKARKRAQRQKNDGEGKEKVLTEEELILREIYNNNIDENLLERIKSIDNPVIRDVLTAARYDRIRAKADLRKKHIRTMKQSPEYSDYEKIFKKLFQKLNENATFFNYEFYREMLVQVRNREDELLFSPKESTEDVSGGPVIGTVAGIAPEIAEAEPEISAEDMLQRITEGRISDEEAMQISNRYPGLSGTVLLAAYFKKDGRNQNTSMAVRILNKHSEEEPDESRKNIYEGIITALESQGFSKDSFKNILKKAIELEERDSKIESPEKENEITPEQHKEKTPKDILDEITVGKMTGKDLQALDGKYPYHIYAILVAAQLKKDGDEEKITKISMILRDNINREKDSEKMLIYKRVLGALGTQKYPSKAFNIILEDAIKLEEGHLEHQGEEEAK